MKITRGWVIALVALGIGLLAFRGIFQQTRKLKAEREWFLKNLGYDFSAVIDSVHQYNPGSGYIYFHVTAGKFDVLKERELNRELRRYGNLRLINRHNGNLGIRAMNVQQCAPGDSLNVNTTSDKIVIFHHGAKVNENDLFSFITGKPFK